jgi:hypothetical protein
VCHLRSDPAGHRRVLLRLALQVGPRRLSDEELLAVLAELVVVAGQHEGAAALVVPVELWPDGPAGRAGPEPAPVTPPRPADPLEALGPAAAPPPEPPHPFATLNGRSRAPRPAFPRAADRRE